MSSTVTPIGLYAQSTGEVTTKANGQMGKMDFLKLLISQMRYQDPLNPTDSAQSMAQLSQYSSLEQMMNMSQSFTALQSVALLGKIVKANAVDGTPMEGKVTAVNMSDKNTPILTLEDGSLVALSDVQEVTY